MASSRLEGQLVDAQGNLIGRVSVSAEGSLWSGEIDLSGAAPSLVSLFTEFEELVNDQVLSLLDEMETQVARLGPRFRIAEEEALPVEDLQIYPALRVVSFRTPHAGREVTP
ncbi:hypothetical protein HRD49_08750 [Corallococcus exiguus]|uniref:hypothetical protein n=1 Tax=Corallococcus TaxID=83461 RepID=UPI000EBA0603|nr:MULTISPECIES: hypothetical protein [Corallococcus]NRD53694.1 hypothetical protein [Corallococcus exiguus]NRD61844.1 hypothetical protein [Corallococcus exiguus]RKI12139.1 hypothetical protein D7Y15_18985 [Corallococcus sp. AB030]RUO92333.1 hypothetical protein D7Y11_15320 [Corallococcus sp. AB018]